MNQCKFKIYFNNNGSKIYNITEIHSMSPEDVSNIYIYSQFTNNVDKFENDIYDGDILKVAVIKSPYEYSQPSRFSNDIKYVNIPVTCEKGCYILNSGFIPDDKKMIWLWNDIEVVGNIFDKK